MIYIINILTLVLIHTKFTKKTRSVVFLQSQVRLEGRSPCLGDVIFDTNSGLLRKSLYRRDNAALHSALSCEGRLHHILHSDRLYDISPEGYRSTSH